MQEKNINLLGTCMSCLVWTHLWCTLIGKLNHQPPPWPQIPTPPPPLHPFAMIIYIHVCMVTLCIVLYWDILHHKCNIFLAQPILVTLPPPSPPINVAWLAMWSILNIVTLNYNIGRGEGGEKACFRDLGVVSVIKFKTQVCLNRFCPRL